MPRPEPTFVTFEIDGRQVRAPAGAMLVDGAKYGDVEIPVFCYEPKLGAPVGACRMCLVEIEGIPKLQTACSTPVKDGMVVITSSDRVKGAQNAVVEFLLVNHPLDCPVCDKGGECPLQDISYGWGAGRSRYIEPKRHFKKPLELSPLVAIDRERCILCFRCVRFSQEISEDYQLVFLERGDHTYVGTHDGRPYVGPFTGNIIDLCPVGALTNSAYRFRARPWDIELAGSVCTLCPSQCNVTFTVRDDDKVLRVYPRDNHEVDDGWLCDKGRWGYQKIHAADRITHPMVKDGGELREVSWERALAEAAAGLEKAGPHAAALVDGETSNEEGFLLARLMRDVLGSPHVDSRANGSLDPEHARLLAAPELSASVSDIEFAETVVILDTELVDESPILDLRVRKAARRHGTKIVVVTSRPGSLDATADAIVRFAPGAGEAALAALAAGLEHVDSEEGESRGREQQLDPARTADGNVHPEAFGNPRRQGEGSGSAALDGLARAAGVTPESVQNAAAILKGAGETVVLWGERLSQGDRGPQGVARLLALADALGISGTEGAGLLEVPVGPNARGLREVGCVPNLGPGLAAPAGGAGRGATEIAAGLADGELSALVLFNADPLRTHPDRGAWERGLAAAPFVVAVGEFHNESTAGANVIFPAEAYAEKEGTVTHPDGRIQRVRQAIGHRGEVRPGWNFLVELTNRLGHPLTLLTAPMVTTAMCEATPIYAGLTLEEIGGKGVRWPVRPAAVARPAGERSTATLETPPELGEGLRLGTHRSLWAGPETRHAPILRFLEPVQEVELSPADAAELGVEPGDEVDLDVDGRRVRGRAVLRHALPTGSVFVIEGTRDENATALTNGRPREVSITRVREVVGAGTTGDA